MRIQDLKKLIKSTIIRMSEKWAIISVCVCVFAVPIYVLFFLVFILVYFHLTLWNLSNVLSLMFVYPHWGFWNKFWTWGKPLCGWCILTRHVILPFGKGPWRKLESLILSLLSPLSCSWLNRNRSMLSFLLSSCCLPPLGTLYGTGALAVLIVSVWKSVQLPVPWLYRVC